MDRIIGSRTMAKIDGDLVSGTMISVRCIPEAISQLVASSLRTGEGISQGIKRNANCGRIAAERAVGMLPDKMSGRPWQSEIQP